MPSTPLADFQSNNGKREQRLIVVSNRLPVTINKDKNGEYHFKVSLVLGHGSRVGSGTRRYGGG